MSALALTREEPRSGVSKDGGIGALMVRDGAKAPPHHEGHTGFSLMNVRKTVGWAKAQRAVPTMPHRTSLVMVGTLRFAHPTK
jgi:hypothetical protein